MHSFKQHYRLLFANLGYPLRASSGVQQARIAAAEKRLDVKAPAALRDYYLVAGQERRFNRRLNRLLTPEKWSVDRQRLIFMEENQSVLWWGVSIGTSKSGDPPVHQGIKDEPIIWWSERRNCSVFLTVMLHYHAVSGGFPHCASADAPDQTDYRFEENGWTFRGEVNSLTAYSRPNQVVCLLPPGDLPFMQKWSILAGSKSKAGLEQLSEEIGVTFI